MVEEWWGMVVQPRVWKKVFVDEAKNQQQKEPWVIEKCCSKKYLIETSCSIEVLFFFSLFKNEKLNNDNTWKLETTNKQTKKKQPNKQTENMRRNLGWLENITNIIEEIVQKNRREKTPSSIKKKKNYQKKLEYNIKIKEPEKNPIQ